MRLAAITRKLNLILLVKIISLFVAKSTADYAVLQTQCQCTCPINKLQLQDAIRSEEIRILEDDSLSGKVVSSSPTLSTTSTKTERPTIAAPPTTQVIKTTTDPLSSTSTPTTTLPESSGDDEDYISTNYYVDDFVHEIPENNDMGPQRGDNVPVTVQKHRVVSDIINEDRLIPGPKGEKGDQGLPGFDGEPGMDGENGEIGAIGPPGLPGNSGDKGDKGDQGPRGYPGNMGIQGYRGSPGPIGESGRPGARGSDGPRGGRGEQGIMGQRGIPGKLGAKGEPGEAGTPGKDATEVVVPKNKVAFLVRLLKHFGPSTITTHIIFSQIDFNLGEGYEPSSGSFLVTTEGVYVFHLQVMAMADHIAWLAIQVNGEPVAYVWASGYTSATEQMGTAMTIQQLSRGDVVNVIQKASESPPNYLYAHYSLFSGYLLG